jgi:hypothetical protein
MTESTGAHEGAYGSAHESLGSAAEEAARLFGAVSDWAKQHGGEVANNLTVALATGLAGLAGQAQNAASGLGHDLDEHLATGAPECAYCPICRTMHVVREASPEVIAHLSTAATALMQAAAAVAAAASSSGPTSRRGSRVEKIDLDQEQGWPDEWPEGSSNEQENQE